MYEALPDTTLTPEMFWIEVLQQAGEVCQGDDIQDAIRRSIEMARGGPLKRPDLRKVFERIGSTGHTLLLIVDDFNCLMKLPELIPPKDNQFFEIFRYMCSLPSQGLQMIVATPRPLEDLWKFPHVSIFFNTFTTATIGKLADDEIVNLLEKMLSGTGVCFTPQDIEEIHSRSGNLPAFVQYYASLLFNAHRKNLDQEGRKRAIQQALSQPSNPHITLTRSLIQRMNELERKAFEKHQRLPGSLEQYELERLVNLDKLGGLPPGVKL